MPINIFTNTPPKIKRKKPANPRNSAASKFPENRRNLMIPKAISMPIFLNWRLLASAI